MATPTYSLSVTGYGGHNPNLTYKPISVADFSVDAQTVATPASIGGIMADGDSIICKDPSGRLRVHKFDAERSNPAIGLYYLLPQ